MTTPFLCPLRSQLSRPVVLNERMGVLATMGMRFKTSSEISTNQLAARNANLQPKVTGQRSYSYIAPPTSRSDSKSDESSRGDQSVFAREQKKDSEKIVDWYAEVDDVSGSSEFVGVEGAINVGGNAGKVFRVAGM